MRSLRLAQLWQTSPYRSRASFPMLALPAEPSAKCVRGSARVLKGMPRVRVYGVEIPEMHVPRLVGGLTRTGTPEALAAAAQIAGAPDRNNSAGRLTPDMRDAILAVRPHSSRPGSGRSDKPSPKITKPAKTADPRLLALHEAEPRVLQRAAVSSSRPTE